MIRALSQCLVVLLVVLAVQLWQLGMQWCDEGHGLHPAIAFTWATLNMVGVVWISVELFRDHQRRMHAIGSWVMRRFK